MDIQVDNWGVYMRKDNRAIRRNSPKSRFAEVEFECRQPARSRYTAAVNPDISRLNDDIASLSAFPAEK